METCDPADERLGDREAFIQKCEAFIRKWSSTDSFVSPDADDWYDGFSCEVWRGLASDYDMIVPQEDLRVSGFGTLMDHAEECQRSIPDASSIVEEITRSSNTAAVTMSLSGTHLHPAVWCLPMGRFSEMRFMSLMTFNQQGQLCREVCYYADMESISPQLCDRIFESTQLLLLSKIGGALLQHALQVTQGLGVERLLRQLHGKVLEASRSHHGNLLLQACISTLPSQAVQFIAAEFEGHAQAAALHTPSCWVLQRLLEHCPRVQMQALVEELLEDVCDLMMHRSGNYIVQHLLKQADAATRRRVVDSICASNVPFLSRHGCASNVLRVVFEIGSPEDRIRMAQAVAPNRSELVSLSKHRYGNFLARQVKALRQAPHN